MLTIRTPEAHAWAAEQFKMFRSDGQFVPLGIDSETVVFPGFDGGAGWGGAAVDPSGIGAMKTKRNRLRPDQNHNLRRAAEKLGRLLAIFDNRVITVSKSTRVERTAAMPTRNVNLTDELDRFVARKVKTGRYENASEVVRAGLRNLEREEQECEAKLAALRAAIDEGDASGIAEGNVFGRVRKAFKLHASSR
jgi:antitoxin ParD1/3/4